MIFLELLVLLILAAFVANGVRAGSIEALGRVIGAIAGYVAAKAWSGWLVGILGLFMPASWAWLASFIVIFLAINNLIGFVFSMVDRLFQVITKLPFLKQIDGIVGGVLGFLEGIVVIGGIAYLLRLAAADTVTAQSLITLKTIQVIEAIFTTLLAVLL